MSQKIIFTEAFPYAGETMGYPNSSSQHIPKWFKEIPANRNNPHALPSMLGKYTSTVKQCTPFLDAFTSGYMISLPHDIGISINEDGFHIPYWGVERQSQVNAFSQDQEHRVDGIAIPDGYNKAIWRATVDFKMSLPKGYSALITHPFNRYDLPFLTFSGVVDFDKYSAGVLVANIVIKKNFEGILEKGTPIAQILPFKRDNWESEKRKFSEEENAKGSFMLNSKLIRSYQYNFWSKKSYK
jgi:hypothetical protein